MEAPHCSRAVTACLSQIKASSGSKNDRVMSSLKTISGGLIGIRFVLWRLCVIELLWRAPGEHSNTSANVKCRA